MCPAKKAELIPHKGLTKVSPCSTRDNAIHRVIADMEMCRHFAIAHPLGVQQAYLTDLFSSQAGLRASLATSASAFVHTVINVLLVCTKEQMIGANARGVVAMVKNVKPLWDVAVMKLVGETMGANLPSIDGQGSIPVLVPAPRPYPTRRSLFDFFPEVLNGPTGWYDLHVNAFPRGVVRALGCLRSARVSVVSIIPNWAQPMRILA